MQLPSDPTEKPNPDEARAVDVVMTAAGTRVTRRLEVSMCEALEPMTTTLDPDQGHA